MTIKRSSLPEEKKSLALELFNLTKEEWNKSSKDYVRKISD